MKTGKKVQVSEFAETPIEGVNQFLSIVNQDFPDTSTLSPTDVVIEVKSAALGWVAVLLLMWSRQLMLL